MDRMMIREAKRGWNSLLLNGGSVRWENQRAQ
jgi:hypothetical protein